MWEIVTTPEHMGQWFGDAGAERNGNVITMAWEEHGEADLEVVREDAPEHVRLPLGRERQGGRATRSSSSRSPPEDDGTRVRVVESGFASLQGHRRGARRVREGNVGGWAHELGDLERYAQTVTV